LLYIFHLPSVIVQSSSSHAGRNSHVTGIPMLAGISLLANIPMFASISMLAGIPMLAKNPMLAGIKLLTKIPVGRNFCWQKSCWHKFLLTKIPMLAGISVGRNCSVGRNYNVPVYQNRNSFKSCLCCRVFVNDMLSCFFKNHLTYCSSPRFCISPCH